MLSAHSVRRIIAAAGIAGLGATLPVVGAGTASATPHNHRNAPVTAEQTAGTAQAPAAASASGTYTVAAGDTLFRIASALRIDGGWPALYELNRAQLANGPDWIDVGQVLKLTGTAQAPAAKLTEDTPAAAPLAAKPSAGSPSSASSSSTSSSSSTASKSTTPTQDAPTAPAAPAAASSKAATAIAFAKAQLGKPYVYGAAGPNAYDCSGLVQAAWKAAGVSLPRVTTDQYAAGRKVSTSALQPGDLVFYYSGISHVGMYIGNGQIIHAPNSRSVVKIVSVDSMPIAGATRPA